MRTDDLIGMLARRAGPAPRGMVPRRLGLAMSLGLLAGIVLALGGPGFIPAATFALPAPWFKLSYAATLAIAAAWLAGRLARPGGRVAAPATAAGMVVLGAIMIGVAAWLLSPGETRLNDMLGHSWRECPFLVLGISLPALAALLRAMGGLAPTRPRAAGFAAGLLAGALGAGAYALACTELAISFVAAWYTLGVLSAAVLGTLLGPRMLRW